MALYGGGGWDKFEIHSWCLLMPTQHRLNYGEMPSNYHTCFKPYAVMGNNMVTNNSIVTGVWWGVFITCKSICLCNMCSLTLCFVLFVLAVSCRNSTVPSKRWWVRRGRWICSFLPSRICWRVQFGSMSVIFALRWLVSASVFTSVPLLASYFTKLNWLQSPHIDGFFYQKSPGTKREE